MLGKKCIVTFEMKQTKNGGVQYRRLCLACFHARIFDWELSWWRRNQYSTVDSRQADCAGDGWGGSRGSPIDIDLSCP